MDTMNYSKIRVRLKYISLQFAYSSVTTGVVFIADISHVNIIFVK